MQSGEAQDVEEVAKVIHVDYTVNIVRTAVLLQFKMISPPAVLNSQPNSCHTPRYPHTPMFH
jgi:hypothetical protein